MDKTLEITLINACLIALLLVALGFIRGNLAERCYSTRLPFDKLKILNKWSDKTYYTKWTRRLISFVLPLELLICLWALFIIVR